MFLMALTLAVVAFIETAVFFYLKRRASEITMLNLRATEAELLFEEATHTYKEAQDMYDEATWLVVQAKAGDTPLPN